eukprot:TRINITY_DN14389_c0_g1_i1.p1 TRINITY_DN14389_c0_g1~~TRINITY_DN14389_c0_g1_i1.p1  ORF type:complete len:432 (+),score=95.22 TRINITY_DN14389_c0_g1_i1:75-1298(+)
MAVVVSAEAHAIDTRRAVHDKFSDVMDDLSLVSHVGDERYGSEPREAVSRLRQFDDTFHTDIHAELDAIEKHLRRQKLQQQYYARPDNPMQLDAWVEDQLMQGGGEVTCRLPQKPSRSLGRSKMVQEGTCYNRNYTPASARGSRIERLDRVQMREFQGVVQKVLGDRCVVLWDTGSSSTVPTADCALLQKAHPARVVTDAPTGGDARRRSRSARTVPRESALAPLFSRQSSGVTPSFLKPPPDDQNRRVQLAEAKKKAASKEPQRTRSLSPRSRPPQVATRFMEVHRPAVAQERVIEMEEGKPLRLHFDPETLCICDTIGNDVAVAAVSDLRGMRITHIASSRPPFSDGDAVHTAAAVRQRLARAQLSKLLVLRAEPWSLRRAVEKKRREFQEKIPSQKKRSERKTG